MIHLKTAANKESFPIFYLHFLQVDVESPFIRVNGSMKFTVMSHEIYFDPKTVIDTNSGLEDYKMIIFDQKTVNYQISKIPTESVRKF